MAEHSNLLREGAGCSDVHVNALPLGRAGNMPHLAVEIGDDFPDRLRYEERAYLLLNVTRLIRQRHGPPDVLARLGRGESVDPAAYYFRTTPRFETGAPSYAWLNDVVAVGSAVRRSDAVILDVYAVT
jgi:hypothetical protein